VPEFREIHQSCWLSDATAKGITLRVMHPPLACNLNAIRPSARPRYKQLVKLLRSAIADRIEIEDGYRYSLDDKIITLPESAEWITLERQCCPFLEFQLDVTNEGNPHLTLRGPAGAKAILNEEFPILR